MIFKLSVLVMILFFRQCLSCIRNKMVQVNDLLLFLFQMYSACWDVTGQWSRLVPREDRRSHTHTFPLRAYEKICDTDGDAKSIAGALCAEAEQRHSLLWENAFVSRRAETSASGRRDRYGRTMSSINPGDFPSSRPLRRSPAARYANN